MQEMTPVLFTGLKCVDCLATFDIVSPTLVHLCNPCTHRRIDEIFAGDCGHHMLPVPGDRVSCGLRKDLPKDKRGHAWVSLGTDVRHFDDGFLLEAEVFACMECGRDKMKSLAPKPRKPKAEPKFDPEVKKLRDAFRRKLFDQGITGRDRDIALAKFDRLNS